MLSWLRQLALKGSKETLTDRRLSRELAKAVGRFGDAAIASSLIRAGASGDASMKPSLALLRALSDALRHAFEDGTEFTPGTGTEFTPGTGTEATPGTGTEFTPGTGRGTGTEATPGTGTGTEATPGTGTEATPGTGTGTEATPGTGTGTESTPGTGTEATPGTGTEASIGNILSRLGEFEVTFRALIDYGSELRKSGALLETGID